MESKARRKPGRPADTIHGTIAALSASGRPLAWSDGSWAGDAHLVRQAKRLCADHPVLPVLGTGAYVVADADSAVAAYAILQDLCGPGSLTGDVPVEDLVALLALSSADPDDDSEHDSV